MAIDKHVLPPPPCENYFKEINLFYLLKRGWNLLQLKIIIISQLNMKTSI